jgi:dTDP-4-amino-4,6-dideoxygalactose transaminase
MPSKGLPRWFEVAVASAGLLVAAPVLCPIRLRLERPRIERSVFVEEMRKENVGFSVHWRPLHLHPYYAETFGWQPESCPSATALWPRLISLPIFSSQTDAEASCVVESEGNLSAKHALR